jgi:hypothetical protein
MHITDIYVTEVEINHDSSDGIVTRLWARKWRNRGSIPSSGKRYLPSPPSKRALWPRNLLPNWYRTLIPSRVEVYLYFPILLNGVVFY